MIQRPTFPGGAARLAAVAVLRDSLPHMSYCAEKWWEAEISGWNEETGEHHLTYNRGMEDESFEIGDLSEFHDEEIRCSSH